MVAAWCPCGLVFSELLHSKYHVERGSVILTEHEFTEHGYKRLPFDKSTSTGAGWMERASRVGVHGRN